MGNAGVLVVEDDGLVSWALQRAAAALKVPVEVASTGAEALLCARAHRCGLAFVDIRLPDADGIELIPELRQFCPETRFVVITADASASNRERASRLGAWHFLEKPFEMVEIARLINECFSAAPERRVEERQLCRAALKLELFDEQPPGTSVDASALDLSTEGLRLRTSYPLCPGQRLRVHPIPGSIHGEKDLRRDAMARVIWTREEENGLTAGLAYLA